MGDGRRDAADAARPGERPQPRAPCARHGRAHAAGRHRGERGDARRHRRQRPAAVCARRTYEAVHRRTAAPAPRPACAASRSRSTRCRRQRAQAASGGSRCWQHPSAAPGRTGPAGRRWRASFRPTVHAHAGARPCARAATTRTPPTPRTTSQRLRRVLAAEKRTDPAGRARLRAPRVEMARWLALWMAFDDIVLRGRPQEPRQPPGPRAQRGQGRRRRPAARVRPLQARRARVRRHAARSAWRAACWPGTASAWPPARRPGRCR